MGRKSRIFGFLITLVFVVIVFHNVSLDELSLAFHEADYRLVVPAVLATLTGYLLRTIRWQRIVKPVARLGFRDAFSVLMMGFTANNLLPARLGEFVRAYLLGKKIGTRKTYGLATIVLERVCDGLTLIALLGLVSLLMPLPVWGRDVQLFSSAVFLAAAAAVLLLLLKEDLTVGLIKWALKPVPSRFGVAVLRATDSFISGLHSLKSKRTLGAVIGLSVVVWLLEACSYFLMMRAFGVRMEPFQQVLAAAFLLVVVNLGIMIPSAPGYVGTFQFFAIMALGAFGVPKEMALAVAIASHLMQYVLVTGIGLFYFAKSHLSFWTIEREVETEGSESNGGDVAQPAALR